MFEAMEIMDRMREIGQVGGQGMTVGDGVLLIVCILTAQVVRKLFQNYVVKRLIRLSSKTGSEVDDELVRAIEKPVGFLILLAGLHVGLSLVGLPREPIDIRRFFEVLLLLLVTVDVAWLFMRLADVLALFLQGIAIRTDSALDDQLVPLIRKSIKVGVAILAFVLIVQNLGYQVTGLLAGLGIGGLAIALAAQSTLANLFGSVTIILDRPFRVGETIQGDGFTGVVEEIGLRSSRIRTFEQTLVTVPNANLANMTVDNWSQRPARRVQFTVGVTYETTADRMVRALEGIRRILAGHPEALEEGSIVRFSEFGGSSLDILVRFFTPRTEYLDFLRVREEVNLAVMRALADLGLEVAFPTRTVYLRNEGYWGDPARAEASRIPGRS
ncbi:MAG: mechanosensitive ion channel family protein [Candidatus Eisenbacteria bacterium]